ncbi:NKG2-A/NKG2-B type II integral membrane protein-like [Octodon degus]|uniref:NKG2-A/NKG2-B type II integral membrane protein-like n=1 Tax=Octodon degus TaxID=10160 RepID=A0A6P6E246_OCTDE|nr:NKG2-A/NKG2-B type II integral membrane protein-like [Octodon degus]
MSNQRWLNLAKHQKKPQRKPAEATGPISLTEQEMTHVELSLSNASQASPGNEVCKEKLTAGILGLFCLKLAMMLTVTVTISSTIIEDQNKSSLVRTPKGTHNLSSAYHCAHCPNEWLTFSNNCYYFGSEKKTWNESLVSCSSKNSSLTYIDDGKELFEMTYAKVVPLVPPTSFSPMLASRVTREEC